MKSNRAWRLQEDDLISVASEIMLAAGFAWTEQLQKQKGWKLTDDNGHLETIKRDDRYDVLP